MSLAIYTIEIYHLYDVYRFSLCRLLLMDDASTYCDDRSNSISIDRPTLYIEVLCCVCLDAGYNHPRIHLKNKKDFLYTLRVCVQTNILKKDNIIWNDIYSQANSLIYMSWAYINSEYISYRHIMRGGIAYRLYPYSTYSIDI